MTARVNTRLVPYGIYGEKSDLRAHVCVRAGVLYVYPTANGVRAASGALFREVQVTTGAIVTARGRLVPPERIDQCLRTDIPPELLQRFAIAETDSTTTKGRKATQIVAAMLEGGHFPLVVDPSIVTATKLQYEGLDIVLGVTARIQVKCDYAGGETTLGGTGNLFIQTHECNPYQQH